METYPPQRVTPAGLVIVLIGLLFIFGDIAFRSDALLWNAACISVCANVTRPFAGVGGGWDRVGRLLMKQRQGTATQ